MFLNTNSVHNALNIMISVLAVWGLFDWSSLGIDSKTSLTIIAAIGLTKLTMNAVRDGLKGMVEIQPPVVSAQEVSKVVAEQPPADKK